MDRRFLNSQVDPAPFTLLGRTLYPWCLKYRVRLHAFDSPLVNGSNMVTPADLLFACQVCAEEPLGKVGIIDRARLVYLSSNPYRFEALLKAFADYILIDNWPKFWEQDQKKSGGSKGLPWPMSVVANLVANGVPYKQAWEMPECQAIWLNAAFAIRRGATVAIMSPEEEAYIEEQINAGKVQAPVANPAG